MEYTFEKGYGGRYQVRLNGEFIMHVNGEDANPHSVDSVLFDNGWRDREHYYTYLITGGER